ncbi:MAG TPA: universal stress protein [bacterium]|jgi:nucleotide-binding universal stress UspA family protein|nr:universal stress protein [bacterium]
MFSHLLVPLDGSALAESVLPAVILLARRLPARVTFLHVVEPHAPVTVHGDRHLTRAEDAGVYLEHIVAQLAAQGVQASARVRGGSVNVAAAVAEEAAEAHAELIVLCTHGHGGLRDVLFGSVAQQVLQHGTTPVLLFKPDRPLDFVCRTVVVPLDGSEAAAAALPAAAAIARACGASLRLVSVVPTPETAPPERAAATRLMPSAAAEVLDLEAAHMQAYLTELTATLAADGVSASGLVERGEAVRMLLDAAKVSEADLIVMATHGRSGLAGTWAGSVASRVIGHTGIPLLLVRIPPS